MTEHCMGDRVTLQRYLNHALFGALYRFLDGYWCLSCLALANADLSLTVTDDNEGTEVKSFSTLDHLGYPVQVDQFIFQAVAFFRFMISLANAASAIIARC
jgi:hypothetical protein